jgi:hypothetical protein
MKRLNMNEWRRIFAFMILGLYASILFYAITTNQSPADDAIIMNYLAALGPGVGLIFNYFFGGGSNDKK